MLKFLKVSFVYFLLFIALFSMVDYYAMMAFNVMWFVVPSLIVASASASTMSNTANVTI